MTTKVQVFWYCLKRDPSAAGDQMLLETVSTYVALSAVSGWMTGLLTTAALALQHHSGPKQASTNLRNRRAGKVDATAIWSCMNMGPNLRAVPSEGPIFTVFFCKIWYPNDVDGY